MTRHLDKVTAIILAALAAFVPLAVQTPAHAGGGNPPVKVEIFMPTQVVYGHRPFTMKVRLTNVTEEVITFDGTVKIGGPAWGAGKLPLCCQRRNVGLQHRVQLRLHVLLEGSTSAFTTGGVYPPHI